MRSFKEIMGSVKGFNSEMFENEFHWILLNELYERNFVGRQGVSKIPKIIHQIWIGSSVPDKYKEWMQTWMDKHPDYEYMLWTDQNIGTLGIDLEPYKRMINYGPKSDFLRYHILEKFGGIYADTDFECLKSFDDLTCLEFFVGVGYPSKVELYPGLIGCVPHHPIMVKACEEIDKVTQQDIREKGVLGATSSYFFTNIFFEVVKKYESGIVALPPDYLYPFPNYKELKNKNAKEFIKSESYAIHYWEVSWSKGIKGETDWIRGDKFVGIAKYVYAPSEFAKDDYAKYPNTFDPSRLESINFVYTNIMYLAKLLRIVNHLPEKFVIITHNGDQHVEDGFIGTYDNGRRIKEEEYTLSDNILKLYCQNIDVVHPRIDSIPLGVENMMWNLKQNKMAIMKKYSILRKTALLYINHDCRTNSEERNKVYDHLGNKSWTTAVHGINRQNMESYFSNVACHKFMAAPYGNGFDTHRLWEALYLNTIPIIRRNVFTSFYEDLPICLIDEWDEVTVEFLNREYNRIRSMSWNRDKLTFEWWRNKILNIL